jgi:hypothetical protein
MARLQSLRWKEELGKSGELAAYCWLGYSPFASALVPTSEISLTGVCGG